MWVIFLMILNAISRLLTCYDCTISWEKGYMMAPLPGNMVLVNSSSRSDDSGSPSGCTSSSTTGGVSFFVSAVEVDA